MSWDGNVESYVEFRRQMQDMLIYDSESLRLSTLKAQISGKRQDKVRQMPQAHRQTAFLTRKSGTITQGREGRSAVLCVRSRT